MRLSTLDGQVLVVDPEGGHWVRFVVTRAQVLAEKPHGIDYSLALHGANGERLVGFGNAHSRWRAATWQITRSRANPIAPSAAPAKAARRAWKGRRRPIAVAGVPTTHTHFAEINRAALAAFAAMLARILSGGSSTGPLG